VHARRRDAMGQAKRTSQHRGRLRIERQSGSASGAARASSVRGGVLDGAGPGARPGGSPAIGSPRGNR
jgi:hypothetical protein